MYIDEWEKSRQKRDDVINRAYIEKNYAGGNEKYQKDEAKQKADRKHMEDARSKAEKSRLAYLEEDRRLNSGGGDIDKAV